MRIYKTRQFNKWACGEGLSNPALASAIAEMQEGLMDADLGGHVFKKRVALPGRGKRGGARTLLAYRYADRAVFIYGFAKNERPDVTRDELEAIRTQVMLYMGMSENALGYAVQEGKLFEVAYD